MVGTRRSMLLQNGWICPMDDFGTEFRDGWLLVRDGLVEAVGDGTPPVSETARRPRRRGGHTRPRHTSPRRSKRMSTASSCTAAGPSSTSNSSAGSQATCGAHTASTSRRTTYALRADGRRRGALPDLEPAPGCQRRAGATCSTRAYRIGLGVDGPASNERADLFFEVNQALLVARGRGGPTALTVRQALRLATRGGADVLGRDDIGQLAPGKRADLASQASAPR